MAEIDTGTLNLWAERFLEHRERLLALARRNLNPVLLRRVSPEDVVQDTLSSACGKIDFFEARPDVPLYCKLRTLLFQTIADLERRHLQSAKRDAYREIEPAPAADATTAARLDWDRFADTLTGPVTRMVKADRRALLRQALGELPEADREIIELRNFDGLSNAECAEALGVTPKNASIRYVRALRKLQQLLSQYTEFDNG